MPSPLPRKPGRVLLVAGTRPEAIKMAPLYHAFAQDPDIPVRFLATGQHREMLDPVLRFFGIRPDLDLRIMEPQQSLERLTARLLEKAGEALRTENPDWVIVQGDTTSTMVASLAAFYARIPVAHVEAGLRTYDLDQPFPEEMNRQVATRLASVHFAPTLRAVEALAQENVPRDRILLTGNTVIDALLMARERLAREPDREYEYRRDILGGRTGPFLLVTAHRRENLGQGLERICEALLSIARAHPETAIVLPMHKNPSVRSVFQARLAACGNIRLIEPLDYPEFVWCMDHCRAIITDSGGVQEEATALGKPVLVMRRATERMEAVEAGCARLVGTDPEAITDQAKELLRDSETYRSMAQVRHVFGDGHGCERILRWFQGESPEPFRPQPTEQAPAQRPGRAPDQTGKG